MQLQPGSVPFASLVIWAYAWTLHSADALLCSDICKIAPGFVFSPVFLPKLQRIVYVWFQCNLRTRQWQCFSNAEALTVSSKPQLWGRHCTVL